MARIVTALAGLLLIVLALGLAIAPVFPLHKFVAPAVADFEARTGSIVRLGGADVELFPTPAIVVRDATIVLPDGLGEVDAGRLSLAVAPLPFLSGVARLNGVRLDGATLRLSLPDADLAPLPLLSTLTDLARAASGLRLEATDGTLELAAAGRTLRLDHLSLSARRSGGADRLVAIGQRAHDPLSLTVAAGPDDGVSLELAAPQLTAAVAGRRAANGLDGRLTLTVPDLGALDGPFAAASGAATIDGSLRLAGRRAELFDADAPAFGGAGKLSAALDLAGPRPSIDLRADLKRLPFDVLVGLAGLAADLDPLADRRPVDLGVELKLAEVGLAGGSLRNVHLTAIDRDDRAGVVLDRLAIGNGTLSARIDLTTTGGERRLGAALSLDNLAIRDIATLSGIAPPLSGRLTAGLRLAAHGRSAADLAATLAVDGAASLIDGRLNSLRLSHALKLPALTALTADLAVIGLDRPARLTAKAAAASGPVTIEAEVTPRRLLDGGPAPAALRIDGPAVAASFAGDVDPSAGTASGDLSMTTGRFDALWGDTRPVAGSLDAKVDAGIGRIGLSGIRLLIGDSAFAGLIDLATDGDRDRLTGRLSGEQVDVAAMASALSGSEPFERVDADVRIEAGRITAGPVAAAGGPVDFRLYQNTAEIGLPALSLGGGSGSARLTLAGRDRSALALKGRLAGSRLASLSPLLGGALDGEMKLDVDLRAQGTTPDALAATAAGKVDFALSRGVLDGIDPMALIGRISRSIQTGLGHDATAIAFDRLTGTVTLDDGLAKSGNLAFTADRLAVAGTGSLKLADGILDLRLRPEISGYPAFEVPIAVTGPLAAPTLYPDLDGLVANPSAGYDRLAGMGGAFARLVAGEAPPKLKPASPDAVAAMIDAAATARPPIAEVPAAADAPLPPVKPARPARAVEAPVRQSGGPLDLRALGGPPPPAVSTRICNPGSDGRCIP